MICYTTIPSTSNTLKNLLVNSNCHSSYTNKKFNDKKEQMITIFSTYITPQIKEIHHPALLQECKLNLDAAEYENNMKANMYKLSEKEKFNRFDNHKHWPASIKNKMQWFPFLTIMGHTANKMQENNGLILSLLKMFAMFEIRLSYGDK